VPLPVSYARVLVFVQAGCWALLCLLGIYWGVTAKSAPAGGLALEYQPGWDIVLAIVTGVLAAAKSWLGLRLSRRSRRIRLTVMIVEYLMAGFAVAVCLLTFDTSAGDVPFFACLFGLPLSLIAAILLNGPDARQYFGGLPDHVASATRASRRLGGQRHLFAIPRRRLA
jgi:hypothetical protein